jgi:glyoxylase-like metal-dependent hydrolase (beta-lactamase superfamily II)/8-oxo-dGTP pyrophosphatase MutT (NUDIX family)
MGREHTVASMADSTTGPRPAATLVVLRDAPGGAKVLLTVRPTHLRFMGGATVFPGGAVAPPDRDPRWAAACVAPPDAALEAVDPEGRDALGAFVCALREAFEEVGLLLADGPRIPRPATHEPEQFLAACLERGVRLRTDRLAPAGRWVTPPGSPVRFDAHFFLAEAPEGWEPAPDPAEVARVRWATPAAALDELANGSAVMAPPTIEMLQRLAGAPTVAAAREVVAAAPVGSPRILSTRVSPLVHAVLAPNPGLMTGPGTNTYVVGSGEGCVVIDPAVADEEYVGTVAAVARGAAAILVTHRHGDHTGGVAALRRAMGRDLPVRAWGGDSVDGIDPLALEDGELLSAGAATLRALHTPGHASDHVCFYLEGAATLFSGDTILGEGTAVIAPPDGDMGDYLSSLERLRELHVERIFPGHFRPLSGGKDVVDGYLEHRRERERRIVGALEAGATTTDEVVARAYSDTPTELHPAAALSALAHLQLLERGGRVESADHRWRLRDVE